MCDTFTEVIVAIKAPVLVDIFNRYNVSVAINYSLGCSFRMLDTVCVPRFCLLNVALDHNVAISFLPDVVLLNHVRPIIHQPSAELDMSYLSSHVEETKFCFCMLSVCI